MTQKKSFVKIVCGTVGSLGLLMAFNAPLMADPTHNDYGYDCPTEFQKLPVCEPDELCDSVLIPSEEKPADRYCCYGFGKHRKIKYEGFICLKTPKDNAPADTFCGAIFLVHEVPVMVMEDNPNSPACRYHVAQTPKVSNRILLAYERFSSKK